MSSKNKVWLLGFLTLLGSILALLILSNKNEKTIPTTPRDKPVNQLATDSLILQDTTITQKNLYFYEHPYLSRADKLGDEKQYDSAIHYYKQASLKFKKEKNWEAYVWVRGYIGRIYLLSQGMNYKEALPHLLEAVRTTEQTLGARHPYMAILQYYLGLYYYNSKDTEQALEMYESSLTLIKEGMGTQNIYTANLYNALGDLYYYLLYKNSEAESFYLKAVEIKDALPGEKDPELIYSYYNLASLNLMIGDYEEAQSFCYQAIEHTRYVKSHRSYWEELLEGLLANIFIEQLKYSKAIDKLKDVIRINRENNGDRGYLSYYHSLLADTYSRISNNDSAIINYQYAFELMQSPSLYNNQQVEIGNINYGLGMTYLKMKKFEEALLCFNKCLEIRTAVYGKTHAQTALAYQGIGAVYQETGLPKEALSYFQKGIMAYTHAQRDSSLHSVPRMSEVNNSFNSFQLIENKASSLKQLHENDPTNTRLLTTSLSYYALADSLITSFREEYDRESAKLLFTKNNQSFYEEAIACAALLHQKTANDKYLYLIFKFIAKRKSSLLLEALNKDDVFKEAGIPLEEQQKLQKLQQELSFLQSRLEEENLDDDAVQAIHLKIHAKEKEYHVGQEKLKQDYPYYALAQPLDDTIQLGDVSRFSAENNTVVIEYFWGEKNIYALGIYKDKSKLLKINLDSALEQQFDVFHKLLTRGYSIPTKTMDFQAFQQSSHYLYKALVNPLLHTPEAPIGKNNNKPDIIIIPDGPLTSLPFEALVTSAAIQKEVDYRRLNYLINDYSIHYNYSAGLLLKEYPKSNADHNLTVLALSFTRDAQVQEKSGNLEILRNSFIHELPGSAKEIRAISSHMKGQFYMGDKATEQVFKREAPYHDILHLAVHGEANNHSSYNSRLIFKNGADSLNDGSLYAYELYSIPIKAKLAVLSACESGIGKLNPGEGMFSMGRGFVYAGCPAVMMSLWRVHDNATATLMSQFYQELSGGNRIDQSIRQAKLKYLATADKRTAHPANWAAFIALGKTDSVVKEQKQHYNLFSIEFILTLLVVTFIIMMIIWKYQKVNQ